VEHTAVRLQHIQMCYTDAQVIVLEENEKYLDMLDPEDLERRQRRAFKPMALVNPRIKPVGSAGARFFEGCLSVPGYQASPPFDAETSLHHVAELLPADRPQSWRPAPRAGCDPAACA
jgi:Polypeptide deformylase